MVMNRMFKVLVVIAIVSLISPLASAEMNGRFLAEGWKAFQQPETENRKSADVYNEGLYTGFVLGVCDGILKLPSGVTIEQRMKAVGNYLDAHPERLHEAAVLLVVEALNEAFPKAPKKSK
jgi:hypothetical protein